MKGFLCVLVAGAAGEGAEMSGEPSSGMGTSDNASGGVDTVVGDGLLKKPHFEAQPEERPDETIVEAGVEVGVKTGVETEEGSAMDSCKPE